MYTVLRWVGIKECLVIQTTGDLAFARRVRNEYAARFPKSNVMVVREMAD